MEACPFCGKHYKPRLDGKIRHHKVLRTDLQPCPGSPNPTRTGTVRRRTR